MGIFGLVCLNSHSISKFHLKNFSKTDPHDMTRTFHRKDLNMIELMGIGRGQESLDSFGF